MDRKELIEALSNANGISGFEKDVVALSETVVKSAGLCLERGGLGNLYITRIKDQGSDKPLVLLDAHSDELGFMVQAITARGLIKVVPVGSWDPRNIPAHKVRIKTEKGWIKGVFASKPPHFMTEAERTKPVTLDQLLIDIGASTFDEAINDFGVQLGAPIVPDVVFEWLGGDLMMGKAFDNRLGCALVLELMYRLTDAELNVRLVGALSSQEEVGARGAKLTANALQPTVGIIFEGTPSDDGFTEPLEVQGGVGRGPQIRHRDAQMISNPEFTKFAINIAKQEGVSIQEAVRTGGSTNGAIYHTSHQGAPSIVIGVPVRYAHTHYGISSLKDYDASLKWAEAVIRKLDGDTVKRF